jgi:hypothetical protein
MTLRVSAFILLVSSLPSLSKSSDRNPVLRVEEINKSSKETEVQLQPMLAPRFSAVVEEGDLNRGDVIQCEQSQRAQGTDEYGNKHHIIVLKCGKRVLLLREVRF